MNATSIEWTDRSVNPIRARDKATGAVGHWCVKVSPGCKHCYSARFQPRRHMHDFVAANAEKVEPFLDRSKLEQVLRTRKPCRIFWCDMTDMFGEWVPDEWIDQCFAVMALTPHLTHQVLTKRPERMRAYLGDQNRMPRVEYLMDHPAWLSLPSARSFPRYPKDWPLPNVWLGVSVENQEAADDRIPLLLQTPAAVRFLSVEPLLGPVSLAPKADRPYRMLSRWYGKEGFDPTGSQPELTRMNSYFPKVDLVIVGGESGPGARACDVAWIRSIVEQCRAAAVPTFVKQLGGYAIIDPRYDRSALGWSRRLRDLKGADMEEWPEDLRRREMPESS